MSADERATTTPSPGELPLLESEMVERDQTLAALAKALADDAAGIVVVEGTAGTGKTTLLGQIAKRLRQSERFERVVYTSYAGGGLPELALRDLSVALMGERHEHRPAAPQRLLETLAEHPTLILWDDVDAVLGEGPLALTEAMQQELMALAERLAEVEGTRLAVTCSRTPAHPSLARDRARRVHIGPLTSEEALALWSHWQPTETPETKAITRLADLLGGNPMALRLAADMVRAAGVAETEHALEEALPGFVHGEGRLRGQGLHAATEAWLRQQDAAQREAITPIGLFVCGFVANLPARVGEVDDAAWARLLGLLVRAGLARTEPITGLKVPYVRVARAFSEHLLRRLDPQQALMLQSRYAGNYMGLANWMTKNRERAAEAVDSLRRCEMPNLRRALPILIASAEIALAREYSQRLADLLEDEGLEQEAALVRDAVGRAVADLLAQERPLPRAAVSLLLDQADSLVENRRFGDAGTLLQQIHERLRREDGVGYKGAPAKFDQARTSRRLGHALVALRQADLAFGPLVQAAKLLEELGEQEASAEERLQLALDLAPLYQTHNQAEKAQQLWQGALPLAEAAGRSEDAARIRQQLAGAALRDEDYALAEEHLQAALAAFDGETEVPQVEAMLQDQLAALALQRGAHDQATDALEKAVALHRGEDNRPAEAAALVRLATLLRETGRSSEAEAHLTRAAAIYQEARQRPALATIEIEMAQLLLSEGRTADARVHAEAARALLEDPKTPGPLWRAYALLEELDRKAGDLEAADEWHVSAIEAYARSGAPREVLTRWAPVLAGLAQACRGQALDQEVVAALEAMEQKDDWRETVHVMWRVLGGERGDELYHGLDIAQAVVVKALLAGIEAPEPEDSETAPEAAALTTEAAQAQQTPPSATAGLPREVQATLRRVFATVLRAVQGDDNARFVAGMLLGALQGEGQPEPLAQFARAMQRIMAGERGAALAKGLPKELAEPVEALLAILEKAPRKGQQPPS